MPFERRSISTCKREYLHVHASRLICSLGIHQPTSQAHSNEVHQQSIGDHNFGQYALKCFHSQTISFINNFMS